MAIWKDEQTKLTATFLNNVSVATTVASTFAPSFSLFYGVPSLTPDQVSLVKLAALALLVIGIAIHSLGRLVLRSIGSNPRVFWNSMLLLEPRRCCSPPAPV